VLVPRPSYPLFDLLSSLEGVDAAPYRLDRSEAWRIDRAGLEASVTRTTRAVLVVSPNNPTGSILSAADREWVVDLARRRDLALISDEVFAEYAFSPDRGHGTSLVGEQRALTFVLGGLSKSAGLPQMKLAWIVVTGPDVAARDAMERLEIVADTYLSVSTPVQLAAGRLIAVGGRIREDIRARTKRNLASLRARVREHPALVLLEPEGGWSAVVRVPRVEPEEQIVLRLLTQAHVLVHPGYFFDFEEEAFLVLSLLPDPKVFDEALSRILAHLAAVES
jgi:alanine-synthesizing transaminase